MGIECPRCNQPGKKVKSVTVKHLVTENIAEKVPDKGIYYLCMSEDCDVVYYNLDREDIFNRTEIKVPIWFKKDADPKYICYCSKVTEEEIIDAVINQGAENINDVIKITGAMENGNCTLNNPLGKCCGSIIMETINKVIKTNR